MAFVIADPGPLLFAAGRVGAPFGGIGFFRRGFLFRSRGFFLFCHKLLFFLKYKSADRDEQTENDRIHGKKHKVFAQIEFTDQMDH